MHPASQVTIDPVRLADFWRRVDRTATCWMWLGHLNDSGYGSLKIGGRTVGAHRTAWEIAHGSVPDGLHVLHRCDNPRCVNPSHLFLGTNHDNVLDRHAKGRSKNLFATGKRHPAQMRKGERHWCAKLDNAAVAEIRNRRLAGESLAALAAAFGVHHGTVSRIARGVWRSGGI